MLYLPLTVPEVTWLCQGKVIKPSSYFQPQLLPTGEVRLVITNAYMEDAGEYTIRVANPVGETTATAQLIVKRKFPLSNKAKQHSFSHK